MRRLAHQTKAPPAAVTRGGAFFLAPNPGHITWEGSHAVRAALSHEASASRDEGVDSVPPSGVSKPRSLFFFGPVRAVAIEIEEDSMNSDTVAGNWKQFKGKVQTRWGKLTNDSLDVINGKKTQLVGKVQEAYGISRDEAEKQVKEFERDNADYRFED